jgi:hypothetical protein
VLSQDHSALRRNATFSFQDKRLAEIRCARVQWAISVIVGREYMKFEVRLRVVGSMSNLGEQRLVLVVRNYEYPRHVSVFFNSSVTQS